MLLLRSDPLLLVAFGLALVGAQDLFIQLCISSSQQTRQLESKFYETNTLSKILKSKLY